MGGLLLFLLVRPLDSEDMMDEKDVLTGGSEGRIVNDSMVFVRVGNRLALRVHEIGKIRLRNVIE